MLIEKFHGLNSSPQTHFPIDINSSSTLPVLTSSVTSLSGMSTSQFFSSGVHLNSFNISILALRAPLRGLFILFFPIFAFYVASNRRNSAKLGACHIGSRVLRCRFTTLLYQHLPI